MQHSSVASLSNWCCNTKGVPRHEWHILQLQVTIRALMVKLTHSVASAVKTPIPYKLISFLDIKLE